jgi:hypothetical protein
MPAVLSTPAGATVIYFSSTWPWSLHASPASDKMTFWSDLLSALAQLVLLTSTAFITAASDFNSQPSTAISATSSQSSSTTFASLSSLPTIAYSSIASHHPLGNSNDALKHTINQAQHIYGSDRLRDGVESSSSSSAREISTTSEANVVRKMFNQDTIKNSTTPAPHHEVTVDAGQNNLVDCNDFTEQKLLNIVICAISDVNSNVIINGSNADNSTFNDTLNRNISDEFNRFYNASDGSEITGNNSTTCTDFDYESTLYFIKVITTAVILGIIILATVIGEYFL